MQNKKYLDIFNDLILDDKEYKNKDYCIDIFNIISENKTFSVYSILNCKIKATAYTKSEIKNNLRNSKYYNLSKQIP